MKEFKSETKIWNELPKDGMVLSNFVQIDNTIIRVLIIECGPGAACLYILLLSHRNTKTNQCFPSREVLSREMGGISVRQVATYIKRLSDFGAIKVNSGEKGLTSNYYFPLEEFYEEGLDVKVAKKRQSGFIGQKPTKKAELLNSRPQAKIEKPEPPADDDFEF